VIIIVDANIVFSGILNTNSKIGDLLINSKKHFDFIAPDFLRMEIYKHYARLCKISKMNEAELREAEFQICKDITFISEEQIKPATWLAAEKLVSDIDPKDVHYIAYSKHFRSKIWSGDKELMKGLISKGFTNFITTEELFALRQALEII
jgi:predicted nucleic acid-binding protein